MSTGTWGPPSREERDKARKALGQIIGEEAMHLVEQLIDIAIEEYDWTDPDDRK